MKAHIILFIFLAFIFFGNSQILTFDFAGLAGGEISANSNFNNPDIASSTITRGVGLTASANADRFNATNWAVTSIANAVTGNNYMQFTITPNSTCDFSISSILIKLQRSGTGPSQIALRSSVDGFTTNLDQIYTITDNLLTQNFTFTFTQSNITTATTYRIYMYAEASSGSGGPGDGTGNDIIVNGTTNCAPPPNTITTGLVSTSPFTVDCTTSASGSVAFTSTDTFNAGNIYTAQLSNAAGSFATPTAIGTLSSTANSGTINITIPAATATGAGYRIRVVSSNPAVTGADNGSNLSITFNPCTISTGAVTGAPFTVDCSTTASGAVGFTSTGTYNAGNIYTAQLSNAAGSFATPTAIGTLSSTANSGTINITIPAATATGAGYRIRVISSNPTITGSDNGTDLSITFNPCTISTGAVTGAPFTVDCSTTASGAVGFTSTGTYNPANIYTAQLSNAAGSFASPTAIGTLSSTANSGTINITIPAATATGAGYRIRVVSSNPAVTGADNGSNLSITFNPCTISTGAVTGAPFTVDCSTTASGTVGFTSTGTYNAGNIYTAQLSNAAGSFATPTAIGTLSSTANSGTINITIPAATATGAGYRIRVISSNPAVTGTSSIAFTINLSGEPCVLTPPYVTSLIYDGCNTDCANSFEGRSEIVFGNTGSYSVLVSSANVTLTYITGGYTMTNSIVNNTATTATLNTEAGCPGLFIDGFNQTMPPGSSFLLASNALCVTSMIWSDLCGSGPIYIIYSGGTWNDGGNFGNSGGVKNFSTNITATDGTVSPISYSYTAPGSGSDGNYATWTPAGGAASTQGNFPNCRIQPVVLPSSLLSFIGEYNNSTAELTWQAASEQNNSHFTISHSSTGKQFKTLGTIMGAGNSSELLNYRFVHSFPHPGMNYYKLQSTDYDGTTYEKGVVAINAEFSFSFYDVQTATIELYYESDIEIYTTDGKLIDIASDTKSIPFNQSGLFFILDKRSGITERLFIP